MNLSKNLLIVIGLLSISTVKSGNILSSKPAKVLYSKGMDGWRIGGGFGTALYIGDQMDFKLTRHYGVFNELRTNLTLGAYKYVSFNHEYGFVYKHGGFQTLNTNNTQYIECFFDEIQMNFQKSLNGDVGMHGGRFTCNLQYGFGVMYFKSRFGKVDPYTKDYRDLISSVGYGFFGRKDLKGKALNDIYNKKFAALLNVGLNLGFKLNRNLAMYWENSFQISLSNKLSGNLNKTSVIPPDCYFYSGISVFYSFGSGASRLGCPSLRYSND